MKKKYMHEIIRSLSVLIKSFNFFNKQKAERRQRHISVTWMRPSQNWNKNVNLDIVHMMMYLIISMARRWYVTLCIMCHIVCKYAAILTGAKKKEKKIPFFQYKRLCKTQFENISYLLTFFLNWLTSFEINITKIMLVCSFNQQFYSY